ncbi:MAG: hypothetical protein NTX87_02460 [Planctomycetota bacterium]|nr:hypothetical protein [Planctomycetota bacterium]
MQVFQHFLAEDQIKRTIRKLQTISCPERNGDRFVIRTDAQHVLRGLDPKALAAQSCQFQEDIAAPATDFKDSVARPRKRANHACAEPTLPSTVFGVRTEDFMVWKLAEKLGVSRCYDSLAALRRALEDAPAQLPLQPKLGPSAFDVWIH